MNNLFKGAALFVGGAIVGAAVALLLAPKTGDEMRKDVADLMDDLKKGAQDYCEQAKVKAQQIKEQVQEEVKKAKEA